MNLGYFVTNGSQSYNTIKLLTENNYNQLSLDSKSINEYQYYHRKLIEINNNLKSITNKKKHYLQLYIKEQSKLVDFDFKEESIIELNRSIINYIASFKTFTDNCTSKIIKIYGENSLEHQKFKSYLSNLYDTNFEYRFLIRLRDYAIHVGYPVEEISFITYETPPINEKELYKLEMVTSKENLLNSNSFNQQIKKEISDQNEPFDISNHLLKVYDLIQLVYKEFTNIVFTNIKEPANRLISLSKEVNNENISITRLDFANFRLNKYSIILNIKLAKKIIDI